jgi:succinylarginine dihydrolase
MNQMACRTALVTALLLCCGGANAQIGRNYDVKPMNFDLWCQETAHIAPDRCDKRLPQDDEAFNAYRAKIEAYEIPYLQQQNRNARIDTNILHNDPTDRSSTRAVQAQGQNGQTPVRTDAVP